MLGIVGNQRNVEGESVRRNHRVHEEAARSFGLLAAVRANSPKRIRKLRKGLLERSLYVIRPGAQNGKKLLRPGGDRFQNDLLSLTSNENLLLAFGKSTFLRQANRLASAVLEELCVKWHSESIDINIDTLKPCAHALPRQRRSIVLRRGEAAQEQIGQASKSWRSAGQ